MKSAYGTVPLTHWEEVGGTNKSVKIGKYAFLNRTFFNINLIPEINLQWEFKFKVSSSIKSLFSSSKIPDVLLAGILNILRKIDQGSAHLWFSRRLHNISFRGNHFSKR